MYLKKLLIVLCLFPNMIFAQDSIKTILLKSVIITSSRSNSNIENIAASIDVINNNDYTELPIN